MISKAIRRIHPIFLLFVVVGIIMVGSANASSIQLEGEGTSLSLVYVSDSPAEISAFQCSIHCQDGVTIQSVEGVEPFQIFVGELDENGNLIVAGFTIDSPGKNLKTEFAKITIIGSGDISVFEAELEDFDRKPVTLDVSENEYVRPSETTGVSSPSTSTPQTPETPITSTEPVETPGISSPSASTQQTLKTPADSTESVETPIGIITCILGCAGSILLSRRMMNK